MLVGRTKSRLSKTIHVSQSKNLWQLKTWILISQEDYFKEEIHALTSNKALPSKSCLLSLHPFLDSSGILRVRGREQNSKLSYSNLHPVILHGKHPVTKLIIRTEHLRLLHAGPTLLTSSLCRCLYIIGCHKIVRSITRACTVCRRNAAKPKPQMLGQLPIERTTPDSVFERVGACGLCWAILYQVWICA